MSAVLLRRVACGWIALSWAALCSAAGIGAHEFTVSELQRLLQSTATAHAVPFHELRESPWLEAPTESRGTLHSSPDLLEKRVASPREETWRLMTDRMEWVGPGGSTRKQILFSQAPAVAALADALRHIVAGNLQALDASFHIELRGHKDQWTVQLNPRHAATTRGLNHLELQGTGARLHVIIVTEPQGQRTTTRLHPY